MQRFLAGMCFVFFLGVAVVVTATEAGSNFNVRSFGAKGDGKTKDTIAIQKTIDACTAAGGGTVVVPPGTYMTGSIFLKNNVDFYIMSGATLLGSPNKEDYNKLDICPQNSGSTNESSFGAHLILCIEQKNVTLRGPGIVDGNSMKFMVDEKGVPYPGQNKIPWRPSQMLYFVESDHIRVQDIQLLNSTYWTSFYHGCTHVFIRGVKIKNSRLPHTYNGDGIDIDCCEYVSISNCQIDSADDCITLRGNDKKLKTRRPCRFVTITNCAVSTPCNCFRFGVGDGQVNHIAVSNIVIENSRTAFNFVSSWNKDGRGVDMHDILISNVVVDCQILIHMYYKYATKTLFNNISLNGISGAVRQVTDMDEARRDPKAKWLNTACPYVVSMEGKPGQTLQNIRIADVDLTVFPGAQWIASHIDGWAMENIVLRSVDPAKPAQYILKEIKNDSWQGRMAPQPAK